MKNFYQAYLFVRNINYRVVSLMSRYKIGGTLTLSDTHTHTYVNTLNFILSFK